MELTINQSKAARELHESLIRCRKNPSYLCSIKPAIDFVLNGKNCLTYRYILMTALTAKATNDSADILSLQASDDSVGAYDARSLCSKVVFPFQRDFLDDVLNGSNEDPLVNNPGRNQRLLKTNKVANGDPKKPSPFCAITFPYLIAQIRLAPVSIALFLNVLQSLSSEESRPYHFQAPYLLQKYSMRENL